MMQGIPVYEAPNNGPRLKHSASVSKSTTLNSQTNDYSIDSMKVYLESMSQMISEVSQQRDYEHIGQSEETSNDSNLFEDQENTVILSSIKALDYDDLNECVNILFSKNKETWSKETKKKKRLRKDGSQVKVLRNEYNKNPDWSRDIIKKLSQELGLSEC